MTMHTQSLNIQRNMLCDCISHYAEGTTTFTNTMM